MANIIMLSVKIFRQELYGYECKPNSKPYENYDMMEEMFLPCLMAGTNLSLVDFFYSWLFTKR
jgi:hypothetical protein